jgi:N-acetylneuraminic acid mutarotase
MPDPRDHLSAAVLGSTLYVVGGRKLSLETNTARLDVFDLEMSRWSRGTDMPSARGGLAAAAGVQRIYVVGGEQPSGTFEEVEVYDETSGKWEALAPLPTARHGLGAVVIGDRLYVVGGGPTPGLSVSPANEILRLT